ncbi:MAG: hypothetical protein ACJ8C4_12795 [Gemmataceae bacterium]
MNFGILLWLLIILNASMLVWGFSSRQRTYRFPVFAAAVFVGFAIPQLIGLANEQSVHTTLREGALDLTALMSILCLGALWLGDSAGNARPGSMAIQPLSAFNQNRILMFGFFLMLFGSLIYQVAIQFYSKEDFEALGSQWSGSITIVLFFVSMSKYGFAIMAYMYFRTKSPAALLCVIAGMLLNVVVFITGARRADAANTFFVLILGLFLGRRIVLPSWLLVVIFSVGTLWANSVGEFRGNEDETFLQKLEHAELIGNFGKILSEGGPEMRNCAWHIYAANEKMEFDWGGVHWNHLVHAYFPGQIFGYDLKQSIKFYIPDTPKDVYGYEGPPGSTSTGMADAFESFWWLGFLKFYIVGYIMGRWYNRAVRGDLWSQLAFMALMSPALHTITHHTTWLLVNYIHMIVFAWPGLAWAKLAVANVQSQRPVTAATRAGPQTGLARNAR